MKLLPTLKQRKRYVLFQIIANKKISLHDFEEEVHFALHQFFGDLGLARATPQFIKEKFDLEQQTFLFKINHKYVDELKSALILIKQIKNILHVQPLT